MDHLWKKRKLTWFLGELKRSLSGSLSHLTSAGKWNLSLFIGINLLWGGKQSLDSVFSLDIEYELMILAVIKIVCFIVSLSCWWILRRLIHLVTYSSSKSMVPKYSTSQLVVAVGLTLPPKVTLQRLRFNSCANTSITTAFVIL